MLDLAGSYRSNQLGEPHLTGQTFGATLNQWYSLMMTTLTCLTIDICSLVNELQQILQADGNLPSHHLLKLRTMFDCLS